MSDIFISYKREEQPVAKKLADALQKRGWSVWWDPEIRAGERFDDVIDAALNQAKCVLVIWSKLSVKSQNVKDEATYALNKNKMVPIVIEEVDIPYRFVRINTGQLIDWDGSDTSIEFRNLVNSIAKIIGAPPAEAEGRNRKQERKYEVGRFHKAAEAKRTADVDTTLDKEKLWNKMVQIIAEKLLIEKSEVVPEASFIDDLGADELDLVELVMTFEEEFDLEISDEDAALMQTVNDAFVYVCR